MKTYWPRLKWVSGLFLTALVAGSLAEAQLLQPLPEGRVERLALSDKAAMYRCDEIVDKLMAYNDMARQHDQSVSSFLGEVAARIGNWFEVLNPFEGSSGQLPQGTFQALKGGADHIATITDLAYENSSLLASEMDNILTSLRACKLEPQAKPK